MDAIRLLSEQHREVEQLFEKIEGANEGEKASILKELGDALAGHTTIEERIFYPRTMHARTEELLREAVEEHLSAKRVLADLLDIDASDESFDAKCKVLKELIEHHVNEEETQLFPRIRKVMAEELDAMGEEMEALYEELRQGEPRKQIKAETDAPAPLE